MFALFLALCLVPLPSHAAEGGGVAEGYDQLAIVKDVFDSQRLALTAEYAKVHYGVESSELRDPKIIVLHYTAFPTLASSYRFFLPARLDVREREDISSGGAVNVSAHYLVDRDGVVYQLASEKVICRHTIGFNYTSIGIENVGSGGIAASDLTESQAESDAALVSRIIRRHPSIEYLIGHQEYRDSWRPHFQLYLEKDRSYHFTTKHDPGIAFLKRVRELLREKYGIALKD